MVVPKPPVVPARKIGEFGDAIVAIDSRDKIDRNLQIENSGSGSF